MSKLSTLHKMGGRTLATKKNRRSMQEICDRIAPKTGIRWATSKDEDCLMEQAEQLKLALLEISHEEEQLKNEIACLKLMVSERMREPKAE